MKTRLNAMKLVLGDSVTVKKEIEEDVGEAWVASHEHSGESL